MQISSMEPKLTSFAFAVVIVGRGLVVALVVVALVVVAVAFGVVHGICNCSS